MACDYAGIRADNERRYGTDIGRIGPMLLADRYDDRTHFIFELLQNAEDALGRRPGWQGSRAVAFHLDKTALRISHYGKPFDEPDVRGICGIAESTKDLTAIGRFGIGFKSVYAFTDRPEVHSGAEDFAVEKFVWPTAVPTIPRADGETIIVLPLKGGPADQQAIANGLQRLGAGTLLFLRQIEEIAWRVEGGPSGLYLRSTPQFFGNDVRRITVIGQEGGKTEIEEAWLLFSRQVTTGDAGSAGYVEIAFSIVEEKAGGREMLRPVKESPLVVFFPTVLSTHLGFLVQGPYRTTPSRDNVPRGDSWNQRLVSTTASLLVEALPWLRDHGLLDTEALRCLPLDRAKFGESNMFAPLFDETCKALKSEALLPRFAGGHVSASNARLARTQELRELLNPTQLTALYGTKGEISWLSGDITADRALELRQYLLRELAVPEVTPETILPKLTRAFLEGQSDSWIRSLYEFLNGQPALRRRLIDFPLVRLGDGTHVPAHAKGRPQAFLPGTIKTDFPTVRPAVCATNTAREFLRSLGLTEPDPVDDVMWNVLPRYEAEKISVSDAQYEADLGRILAAYATDSKSQREKLLSVLTKTMFVRAVDAGDGGKWWAAPGRLYISTERLKDLFSGVSNVLLVDDAYACLRGEDVRELLEACGATRYLQPLAVATNFTWDELLAMRRAAGCESCSSVEPIEDHTLRGLDVLLKLLPTLNVTTRAQKSASLWEALGDVEDRRGTGVFSGSYRWYYYHRRSTNFDAAFVRQLNKTAWVPDSKGELQRSEFIVFDSLGWKPNPFLLSKLRFKPPIIETLAKEAGIDPGVLDLLKKLGVTSVAELRRKLGIKEVSEKQPESLPGSASVGDALKDILGDTAEPTPPVPDPTEPEPSGTSGSGGMRSGTGTGTGTIAGHGGDRFRGTPDSNEARDRASKSTSRTGERTPGSAGGRSFISYVGAHPEDEEPDPDGLDQVARMAIEEKAITLILASEPNLHRTPTHNPGFDLFEPGNDGQPMRWIEVKAMTGGLHDRPIGISRTQFEWAQKHGAAYWLYIVEHVGNDRARIVCIQDPAGKAQTFTFDHGWLSVSLVDAHSNT